MASILLYLSTEFHRIHDYAKNDIFQHNVTVTNSLGKFSSHCLDFTNPLHTGIEVARDGGLNITNEAYTIAGWLKLDENSISVSDKFCFVGNYDDTNGSSNADTWADKNDSALYDASSTITSKTVFYTQDKSLTTGSIISDGDWHYYVLERVKDKDENLADSTTTDAILSFIDGTLVSSTSIANTKKLDTNRLSFGSCGGTDMFYGYMDDVIFIKDLALWTADFTVPSGYLKDTTLLSSISNLRDGSKTHKFKPTSSGSLTVNGYISATDILKLGKTFTISA